MLLRQLRGPPARSGRRMAQEHAACPGMPGRARGARSALAIAHEISARAGKLAPLINYGDAHVHAGQSTTVTRMYTPVSARRCLVDVPYAFARAARRGADVDAYV